MSSHTEIEGLLDRAYEDLLESARGIASGAGLPDAVVNILEYQGATDSFFNVSLRIPSSPLIPDTAGRPRRARETVHPPLQWAPYVRNALVDMGQAVDKVFEEWQLLATEGRWAPGVFIPEYQSTIRSWRDWWSERKDTLYSDADDCDERWLELSLLLRSLVGQPCETEQELKSFAETIYRSLADTQPNSDLDADGFLVPPSVAAVPWRFSNPEDQRGVLRDLLEFIYLVPVPAAEKTHILYHAFRDPSQVNTQTLQRQVLTQYPEGLPITAIGGPIVYLGQLQAIVYVAAPWSQEKHFDEDHSR